MLLREWPTTAPCELAISRKLAQSNTRLYQLWTVGAMIRSETTTVVFTDLVGSTELATRLGHAAYEALRGPHFEMLRLAASVHQGNEIKSTGDGLVFAFASAAEA